MPRVLRIMNRFNLGGPTYNAAYLTKYMAPEYETLLIGGEKDDSEESSMFILTSLGIEPVIIKEMRRSINPINDLRAFFKIRTIIKKFKPDIVHTHAAKAGTIGRLAAMSCKVPIIVHTFHGHVFHSYFGTLKTKIYKWIEHTLANKTNAIIAISEKQKEELTSIYSICKVDKARVISLGFDLTKFQENKEEKRRSFRKTYFLDDDEIAVSLIGRLVPIKNHELFLESLKIVLNNTTKKVRAFIIGDGELRSTLEKKASELGILYNSGKELEKKATLTFTSWIKEVDWACAGSDIIALTSFNEGTPVSLIEAQAAEKPIITTNVGGIKNIIIENETALLVNTFKKEDFADKLLRLIEDEALRLKMGAKGWKHVKEAFHYERLVKDMQNLYSELMKQKSNKSTF